VIFAAFLAASALHMGEEYFIPGGFMEVMKRFNPRFAPYVTVPSAIAINGLQLLLCAAAIPFGAKYPVFGMSVAALLGLNGIVHVGACIRERGYVPGVVTGVFLYLPLSIYAYSLFIGSGRLAAIGALFSIALGLLYQAVPMAYFFIASAGKKTAG
jgi:hypothetical protein